MMHSLMVQSLGSVQSTSSWVESELPQAEWIGAAEERKGQLILLVSVHSADLHDLAPRRRVFGDIDNIRLLRELWPVVVGVNDTDKHLRGEKMKSQRNVFLVTS